MGKKWTQNELGTLIDMMDMHETWELSEYFERPKSSIRTKIRELRDKTRTRLNMQKKPK